MIINYKSFIMNHLDSIIIISALVAQIIITCVTLFGKSFIMKLGDNIANFVTTRTKTEIEESVKQGFRSALEVEKATLNKKNKIYEIDYSLFKQKRFDTMIELYSKLSIFQGYAYQYTNLFISSGQNVEETTKQKKENYQKSYLNLHNYLINNKLFIKEDLFEKIDEAIKKINKECVDFDFYNQVLETINNEEEKNNAFSKITEISKNIPLEQKEIEKEIRNCIFPDEGNNL